MKINVNKNSNMDVYRLNAGDLLIIQGLQCTFKGEGDLGVDTYNVVWHGKNEPHIFTCKQLEIMLANGMEVLREVKPMKVVVPARKCDLCGHGIDSDGALSKALLDWDEGTKMTITIEEVLD